MNRTAAADVHPRKTHTCSTASGQLGVNWDNVPLGEMSDVQLAKKLGCSTWKIQKRRWQVGTPHFSRTHQRDQINWDKQPLGMLSDKELGATLGVSYNIVSSERKKRGIAAYRTTFERDWYAEQIGILPDKDIAESLGVTLRVVQAARNQRKLPNPTPKPSLNVCWEKQPLGKVSDVSLARTLGTTTCIVRAARLKLGIPRRDLICLTTEGENVNYPEAVIDLYWHHIGQEHQAQVTIGPYRVDWLFPNNVVVEYAGFAAHKTLGTVYKKKLEKKAAFLRSRGYTFRVIWPEELTKYQTETEPQFTDAHVCLVCGKQDRFAIRALCNKHYKEWLTTQHKKLPLSERLHKLRPPLLRIYRALVESGGAGCVDFSHRPTVIKGAVHLLPTRAKKRTLGVLSEYGLLTVGPESQNQIPFVVCQETP